MQHARGPQDTIEKVSFHLDRIDDCEIDDADAMLFDDPRDPCCALSLVVMGSVALLRSDGRVAKLGRDDAIGEIEVLPERAQSFE